MPPGAVQLLAVPGERGDTQPGTGQAVSGQPRVQPLGELPGGERRRVDPLQRLVEHLPHVQVGGRLADRERPLVAAAGQAMGQRGVQAEAGQDVRGGQGGKPSEGTHTQAP